ncbi:MAG: protein kinase [Planctomycetes bacterium]|nr:protein kinase [Planctomycetota bacterium]
MSSEPPPTLLDETDARTADQAFGMLAVRRGYINPKILESCLQEQAECARRNSPVMLRQLLLRRGLLKTQQFVELLRSQEETLRTCPACAARYRYFGPPQEKPPCPKCGTALESSGPQTAVESAPVRLGKYEIITELGRGGMGIVYLARDTALHREVAVKVLRDPQLLSAVQIRRFLQESANAAKLRHPNIVAIHEAGESGGFHYFVMDLIRGRTFDGLIKSGPRDQALLVLEQVSRALHFAHTQGIVHRDVKPGNVIIDEHGTPVLLDFGLSKSSEVTSAFTRTGAVLGTPVYMSPEQVRGDKKVDARSDVYSLGIILYEILTGRVPFVAPSVPKLYQMTLEREPRAPRALNRSVSIEIEAVCLRAIEKEPSQRYVSALEFAEDLRRFREGQPIRARALTTTRRMFRLARRHRKRLAGLALVILGIVFLVGVLGRPPRGDSPRSDGDREGQRQRAERPYQMGLSLVNRVEAQPAMTAEERSAALSEARSALDRAIEEAPFFAAAWRERGRVRSLLGDDEGALADLARGIEGDPADALSHFYRARLWMRRYQDKRALPRLFVYGHWVSILDPREEGKEAAALRERAEKNFETASRLYSDGDDWERRFGEGILHLHRGRYGEAVAALDESHRRFASHPETLLYRGMAKLFRDDVTGAREDLDRVERMGYRTAESLVLRGIAHHLPPREPEQIRTALECYERALQLRPDDSEVFYYRGQALLMMGIALAEGRLKGEDALETLRRAKDDFTRRLEAVPDDQDALMSRGWAFSDMGKELERRGLPAGEAFEAGVNDLERASPEGIACSLIDCERGNRWADYGDYLDRTGGDPESFWLRAVSCYRKVIEEQPDYTCAHCYLAIRYLALARRAMKTGGNPTECVRRCIEHAGRCLRERDLASYVFQNRAEAYTLWIAYESKRGGLTRDLLDQALAAAEQWVRLLPEDARALESRGECHFILAAFLSGAGEDARASWEAAVADWERAIERAPENEEYLKKRIAAAREKLGSE